MNLQLTLVDVNVQMVKAWRVAFAGVPGVAIQRGSILEVPAHAYVSPTNSQGIMGGGLDLVLKRHFGAKIERRIRREIDQIHGGHLPVGHATCVLTGTVVPRYLISTPTMEQTVEDIRGTVNTAWACAAALLAAQLQNRSHPGGLRSVAMTGLGTRNGQMPPTVAAVLMRRAYDVVSRVQYSDFPSLHAALEEELADVELAATPARTGLGERRLPAFWPEPDAEVKVDFNEWE